MQGLEGEVDFSFYKIRCEWAGSFRESYLIGFPHIATTATEKSPNMRFKNLLKWLPLLIILGLITIAFVRPNFSQNLAQKGTGEFKKVANQISGQNSENSKLVRIAKELQVHRQPLD